MMRRTVLLLAVVALAAIQALPASGLTAGTLPGGTPIEVDNTNPIDGDVFLIPLGDATRDILDEGTARLGAGRTVKDTTIVYIMDVSRSMNGSSGVDCDGIAGIDTRLDCEKAGVRAANDAAKLPASPVDETGVGSFTGSNTSICVSTAHDVDLAAGGEQLLVAPDHDGNMNGVADIEEVAAGLSADGATCYFGGLQRADEILGSSTSAANIVIFLSDGINNVGSSVALFVPTNFGVDTTVLSFALGVGVSCATNNFDLGSLEDVAAKSTSTDGACQEVTDLSDLAFEVTSAIGATLESLAISVDGGPTTPIPPADIDVPLPTEADLVEKAATYGTNVPGLAPGAHEICVTATGSDSGGTGSVTDCKTIRLLQLTAAPPTATNELGIDSSHTVTATILGDAGGTLVNFAVEGQNAGATGTCTPNPDCTTDADGQVSFTYSVPVAVSSLGLDIITVTLSADGDSQSIDLTKEWVDTTPPAALCTPTVNPAGKKIPQAPGKGRQGQNQDGFYEIGSEDDLTPTEEINIFLTDSGSGTVFGPFDAGTRIKYTEANGITPKLKSMGANNGKGGGATAVDFHIWGTGDSEVVAVDGAGNTGPATSCLVPPAPK